MQLGPLPKLKKETIQLKKEYPQPYCEICKQSDMWDSVTGVCNRGCASLVVQESELQGKKDDKPDRKKYVKKWDKFFSNWISIIISAVIVIEVFILGCRVVLASLQKLLDFINQ